MSKETLKKICETAKAMIDKTYKGEVKQLSFEQYQKVEGAGDEPITYTPDVEKVHNFLYGKNRYTPAGAIYQREKDPFAETKIPDYPADGARLALKNAQNDLRGINRVYTKPLTSEEYKKVEGAKDKPHPAQGSGLDRQRYMRYSDPNAYAIYLGGNNPFESTRLPGKIKSKDLEEAIAVAKANGLGINQGEVDYKKLEGIPDEE